MSTAAPRPLNHSERTRLLDLGARPTGSWSFLESALRSLHAGDRDAEVLALVAAHAIRLGLRTLAHDALAAVPAEYADDPQIVALRDAARGLRPDVLTPERRIANVRANLDALGDAGVSLRAALDEWSRRVASSGAFTASDGNIVLRPDQARPFGFRVFGDVRANAVAAWRPTVDPTYNPVGEPPVFLAGFETPWLLQRVIDETPPTIVGYSPRVWVYEPDAFTALDALSMSRLREGAGVPRVLWFVGAAATERVDAELHRRIDEQLPTRVHITGGDGAAQRVAPVIARAITRQESEHRRIRDAIGVRAVSRDDAWWAQRYTTASTDNPLRVLILTTRFSSYMKHAADDLANALCAQGVDARLLTEHDPHMRPSSLFFTRFIDEVDPDLIVSLNYPRIARRTVIPDGMPCVTWVQDQMPKLFEPDPKGDAFARATNRDFLVGAFSSLARDVSGYERRCTKRFPVPASTRKFHPGPLCAEQRDRYSCEIAYVGHQSETPEALHARARAAYPPSSPEAALLDRLYVRAGAMLDDPQTRWGLDLRERTAEAIHETTGRDATRANVEQFVATYAQPLADRLLRHQTLEWAAAIAESRGWRLRIYGKGWDKHPTLARYAAPEVSHDDALRTCYAAARVHLHASVTTLCHQRVFECALSGGLPLCRFIGEAVDQSVDAAIGAAVRRRVADVTTSDLPPSVDIADDLDLLRLAALLQRLGRPVEAAMPVTDLLRLRLRGDYLQEVPHTPVWLLADMEAVTFRTCEALEARLARAIDDDAWRASMSGAIAARVRETATHDALAATMLELVRDGMVANGRATATA